jgi:hypothetical protein
VELYIGPNGYGASNVPFYSRHSECTGNHITVWGYYGSGPHSLASDILQWFGMTKKEADHWNSEIVIEFLGFLPKQGAVIPRERILTVIEEIRQGKRKHLLEAGDDPFDRTEERGRNYIAKGGF